MYRCKLEELRKLKGFSYKKWSEESGVSVDTINRIIHPENPDKDSPRINTLEALCKPLGVEVCEVLHSGNCAFASLQTEHTALISAQNELLLENANLRTNNDILRERVESLKDQIIDIHKYYMNKSGSSD